MNVMVPSMAPGQRTLPAEFVANGHNGRARLMAGARQFALGGLGDCDADGNCTIDTSGTSFDTGDTLVLPGGTSVNPATVVPLIGSTVAVAPANLTAAQSAALTSSGLSPAQITSLVTAGSSALNQALALSNGGTVTIGPNGVQQIIANPNTAPSLAAIGTSLTSSLSQINPLFLVAGVGLLIYAMVKK